MTVWNLDHKHRANGPTVAEQIENGIAYAGLLACLALAIVGLAVALTLI